ncbi:hypothetical protein BXZ70DRAFT_1011118 [Cristinia sonorae]|uniref:Secreted protein n=1 Tax=Cristinia sonorae TaxID=1940300 RepID=A0A8K0UGZ7_9AGAR|nr:hypothetical protein BXZ70DRAFT_1011118 [Cristinia sonorae]
MLAFSRYSPVLLVMLLVTSVQAAPVTKGGASTTFYTPGLGACGVTNTIQDFIFTLSDVFLGTDSANKGSSCGKRLSATSDMVTDLSQLD